MRASRLAVRMAWIASLQARCVRSPCLAFRLRHLDRFPSERVAVAIVSPINPVGAQASSIAAGAGWLVRVLYAQ